MDTPDVFASWDRIGPRKQRIQQLYAVFLKAAGRPDTGAMLTKTLFHPMTGYTDISAIEAVHLRVAGAKDHIEPSIGARRCGWREFGEHVLPCSGQPGNWRKMFWKEPQRSLRSVLASVLELFVSQCREFEPRRVQRDPLLDLLKQIRSSPVDERARCSIVQPFELAMGNGFIRHFSSASWGERFGQLDGNGKQSPHAHV